MSRAAGSVSPSGRPILYDVLLAGLGASISITVRLRHDMVHAEDCANWETRDGKVDHIDRRIALEGALDDEQRARLLEIADKCPAHRTLTSEMHIETVLDERADDRES